MKNYRTKKYSMAAVAVITLVLAGCLVSGTFVLSIMLYKDKDLVYNNDFYYDEVDLTEESVWKDHGDNIKNIDVVGFELWATNNSGTTNTINVYATNTTSSLDSLSTRTEVSDSATQVIKELPLATNKTHISYGQSFKYLINTGILKGLVKNGTFKAFVMLKTPSVDVTVDSLRVIVTLSAGA
ncbi:MAG: hypothetical protein ABII79_13605 [bacterium]